MYAWTEFFNSMLNNRNSYEDMIDHRSYAHILNSCETKAWKKKSRLNRIWIHGLRDTGALLYCRDRGFESRSSLNFLSGFDFAAVWVVCMTAMINHVLISFSAVQIFDLSHIHLNLNSCSVERAYNVRLMQEMRFFRNYSSTSWLGFLSKTLRVEKL